MDKDVVVEETATAAGETQTAESGKKHIFGLHKNKNKKANETDDVIDRDDDDDNGNDKKKLTKKKLVIGAVIAVVILGAAVFAVTKSLGGKDKGTEYEMVKVERKNIVRSVDGSSTLEANDEYNVTALAKGEILTDTFSEGDTVQKDQVLYTIESSDAQRKVDSAQNALTKAQQSFADAVKKKTDTIATNSNTSKTTKNAVQKALDNVDTAKRNLSTSQTDVNNLTLTADYTGTISEVLVKEGDSVNDGTKLASIYDETKLKLQVPFNSADASGISEGSAAQVSIASSGETLSGTVESVASSTVATESHAIVKYITIVVDNPGGLKAGQKASAVVGDVACSDLGTFENYDEGYITAHVNGRVSSLYLTENDRITKGQVVGYLTSDSVTNAYKNAESSYASAKRDLDDAYTKLEQLVIDTDTYSLDSSIKSAKLALDDARLSLEDAKDSLDDYTITAPIDGTIVVKNNKAGDKLEQSTNSTSDPMAIIYDMSVLKVQLSIDESDIQDIQVGQSVTITADAAEGMFTGEVTKVGVNGTSSNGVTTYPVDITIADYGDLLPGMNVDCVIEVESAENVLALPAEAIQRGNKVYVKGDKTEENDKAPDGYYSVEVKTGATDGTFIEIKEGLEEGQEVCGAAKPSEVEAVGAQDEQQEQQMQMQGGMGGGMGGPGGGGGMGGGPGGGGGGGMGGGPR